MFKIMIKRTSYHNHKTPTYIKLKSIS